MVGSTMKDSVMIQKPNLEWPGPDQVDPLPIVPKYMIEVNRDMSPTVFRDKGYRFFFFSREEYRMHIHVYCANGEAKFWIEPELELARAHGVSQKQLREMRELIEEHKDDITDAWDRHFKH
jgi:hypothetical protein